MKYFTKLFSPATRGTRAAYIKSMLLWNPLISLAICIFLGDFDHLLRRWANGYLISSIITSICFFAVFLAIQLSIVIAKIRNRPAPQHSRRWYYSISLLAMPFGLHVAFHSIAWIAHFQGWHYEMPNSEDYRVGLLIGTLIAGIFFVLSTRSDAREATRAAEMKLKNMENERLQAQLSALTAQMNPHLLFNALNTVASLVATDPQKAEETIIRLSELYRGVLDSSKNMTHSLATEIGICEAYLAIEKARFGERLQTEIEIDPKINSQTAEVPALCLQPLVENAVKHGLASRGAGGKIRIFAKNGDGQLKISIEDDGIGFQNSKLNSIKSGSGTGLKNCRERLNLQYGNLSEFNISERVGGGTIVSLTIPLTKTVAAT